MMTQSKLLGYTTTLFSEREDPTDPVMMSAWYQGESRQTIRSNRKIIRGAASNNIKATEKL